MRLSFHLFLLVVAASISVGSSRVDKKPKQAERRKQARLTPLGAILQSSNQFRPRVSPDGRWVSYLVNESGEGRVRALVKLHSIKSGRVEKVLPMYTPGLHSYFWAPDSGSLFFYQRTAVRRQYRLFELRLDSGKIFRWTPRPGDRAGAGRPVAGGMLLKLKLGARDRYDAYRLDLKSRTLRLLMRNPGNVLTYLPDQQWKIRVLVTVAKRQRKLLVRARDGAPWKTVRVWAPGERGYPLGLFCNDRYLMIMENGTRDKLHLMRYDLEKDTIKTIFRDPRADLPGSLLVTPDGCQVEAVATEYQYFKWVPLTPKAKRELKLLSRYGGGDRVHRVHRSQNQRHWVVQYASAKTVGRFYLYDRTTRRLRFLFGKKTSKRFRVRARPEPVIIRARDGLKMVSYLTVPPGAKPRNLPLVLLVHGGPWVRDRWRFNTMVQLLALRGYAVLQVNYRGSRGFGRRFHRAGFKELGRGIQRDLWDAVRWAVKRGVADPKRLAIVGGSFGGFSALAGLAFRPMLFKAGIAWVAPSNLITQIYWFLARLPLVGPLLYSEWGHPVRDAAMLRKQSPLYRASRIRAPLLIFHGGRDERVDLRESRQMFSAVRRHRGRVTLVVYPSEGHGFRRRGNRIDFYRRVERFLHAYLGGRIEPGRYKNRTPGKVRLR